MNRSYLLVALDQSIPITIPAIKVDTIPIMAMDKRDRSPVSFSSCKVGVGVKVFVAVIVAVVLALGLAVTVVGTTVMIFVWTTVITTGVCVGVGVVVAVDVCVGTGETVTEAVSTAKDAGEAGASRAGTTSRMYTKRTVASFILQ
jgi:hypothetical protein